MKAKYFFASVSTACQAERTMIGTRKVVSNTRKSEIPSMPSKYRAPIRGSHSRCTTNWYPPFVLSKLRKITRESAKTSNDPARASQRATSSIPLGSAKSTNAKNRGLKVSQERICSPKISCINFSIVAQGPAPRR